MPALGWGLRGRTAYLDCMTTPPVPPADPTGEPRVPRFAPPDPQTRVPFAGEVMPGAPAQYQTAGRTATSPVAYPGAPVTLIRAMADGAPGARGRVLRQARWGIPDFIITAAFWLFFGLVAGLIAVVVFSDQAFSKPPSLFLALALPWVGLAGWPILVSYWKGNGPVIDFGLSRRWGDVGWGVVYGVVTLACAAAIAWATSAIFGDFDSSVADMLDGFTSLPLLIVFAILVGLGAPIVEEIAFRGLLFGALGKRGLAPWLTIGISAIAFSLFHFEPIRFPLLLSTGLILGFARYQRRSTTTSIVAHMTNNIPAAIALVFMTN